MMEIIDKVLENMGRIENVSYFKILHVRCSQALSNFIF